MTYTVTFPSGATFTRMVAFEFSSTGTISFDTQNTGSGTGTALASGNITTAGVSDLVLGSYGEYGGGDTSLEQINGQTATEVVRTISNASSWYKSFTSDFTGNSTATLQSAAPWIGNIIAFKSI